MGLMSAMEQNFNPSLADVNRKTRQGTIVLFVVCVCFCAHTHTHTQLIVKLWMLIPFFAPVCFYFPILLQATLNG
jgi:dolichol kinase